MKKHVWVLVLLAAVLSCTLVAYANFFNSIEDYHETTLDPKEELRKVYTVFGTDKPSINISGTIDLYKGDKARNVPDESSTFYFSKVGDQFYNSFQGKIWAGNQNVMIELDTVFKTLAVAPSNYDDLASLNVGMPFEKWLSDTSFIQMKLDVTENNDYRKLSVLLDGHPEIESACIFYQPKNYQIKYVDMIWHNGMINNDGTPAEKIFTRMNYSFGEAKSPNISALIEQLTGNDFSSPKPSYPYNDYEIIGTMP